ncbi:MAG TPA: hypothetical protein ENN03_05335 [bacterium]|nr:hypothetical protein [bacterium]
MNIEKRFSRFLDKPYREIDADFIADVVHKIKNGLGGIGGFAALLERDLDDNDPRQRLVGRIQDGVIRLNELAVDLTLVSRPVIPHCRSLPIIPLWQDLWNSLFCENPEKGIPLVIDDQIDGKKTFFHGDQRLLEILVYKMIQFIESLGGKISRAGIQIAGNHELALVLAVDTRRSTTFREKLEQFLQNQKPLEARLSFALAIKLIEIHHGRVTIHSNRHDLELISIIKTENSADE